MEWPQGHLTFYILPPLDQDLLLDTHGTTWIHDLTRHQPMGTSSEKTASSKAGSWVPFEIQPAQRPRCPDVPVFDPSIFRKPVSSQQVERHVVLIFVYINIYAI